MFDVTTGILLAILMLSVGWVIYAFIPARPGLVLCGRLVGQDLSFVVIRVVTEGRVATDRTNRLDAQGRYRVRLPYGEAACIRIFNGAEAIGEIHVEQEPRDRGAVVPRTIDLGELVLTPRSLGSAAQRVSVFHDPHLTIWRTEARPRIAPHDRQLLDRGAQFHDPPLVRLSKAIP